MHIIIKNHQMRKLKEMTSKSARQREEERIMRDKELHPYKGTSYPANYKIYIPTPIPVKGIDESEEYRRIMRGVPQKVLTVRTESSPSRYN